MPNILPFYDELLRIILSLLIGSILGFEREYRSKPAGFRTIALICIGATLFTLLSMRLGSVSSQDRIAANIVTGIGFIGAGVVFKGTSRVFGLTTAATIWVAAALGMTVGVGAFGLAWAALAVTLLVLSGFEYLQTRFEAFHRQRIYTIAFQDRDFEATITETLTAYRLQFRKTKESRNPESDSCVFTVVGRQVDLDAFNAFLLHDERVRSFEY